MDRQCFLKIMLTFALVGGGFSASAAETGSAMPSCALSKLADTQKEDLQQYKGLVLYVDFWASWCGPCVKSFPFLNELHEQFKEKGLKIIAVNLDENKDDAKAFLVNYPARFSVVSDENEQCAKAFDVKAMPSSYLIDRNGIVQHVEMGFRSGEAKELRHKVEKLLGGGM